MDFTRDIISRIAHMEITGMGKSLQTERNLGRQPSALES
jgi:hypothetical protein